MVVVMIRVGNSRTRTAGGCGLSAKTTEKRRKDVPISGLFGDRTRYCNVEKHKVSNRAAIEGRSSEVNKISNVITKRLTSIKIKCWNNDRIHSINHKTSLEQTESKRVLNELVKVSSLQAEFRRHRKQNCAQNSRRACSKLLEASEQYGSPTSTHVLLEYTGSLPLIPHLC